MTRSRLSLLATSVILALGAGAAPAQTIYRTVGPNERLTFSDIPPAAGDALAAPGSASAGTAASELPYALRQVASRYPVTLYTGSNCGPCGAGRNFLTARGVPFVERTVNSPEDVAALQRLSGDASLPFLTIGGQQIKGYSDVEWSQFLDAADYPKTSQLPSSYRAPAAAPLVAVTRPEPGTAPARSATPAEPGVETVNTRPRPAPQARPPASQNPAGIRF